MPSTSLNEFLFFMGRPFIFFAAVLVGGDSIPERVPADFAAITVSADPIAIQQGDIAIAKSFPARVTGAWSLETANEDFGGLSAIHASGNSLTMVSDKGTLVRLGADLNARNWKGTIALLPSGCGDMRDHGQRDTEALAADPRTGALWIGFEARNAICRIASPESGGTHFANPQHMAHWSVVSGPEGLVRLRDGRFLVFQEEPDDGSGKVEVMGYPADPVIAPDSMTIMRLGVEDNYLPVDAAELPDGRLLVLARRFRLPFEFSTRMYIVDRPTWRDDEILRAREVLRISRPRLADNFEGVSIDPAGDRLIVWLVSDDNFLKAQRNLLLRLELPNAG